MYSFKLFTFFLVAVAVAVAAASFGGTHAVEYDVTNNALGTPGGNRFESEVGVSFSNQIMGSASTFIWQTFRQGEADRKPVDRVSLFISNFDEFVAYVVDNKINYSANAIAGETGDVKIGFAGVIYHEMTHIWQWNGNGQAPGLVEGIADFVRLKAGYIPSHWVQAGGGDRWDQGYDVTARFLDYCNSLKDGFVADLNGKMRTGYSADFFVELLGKSVDQLWSDYKTQFT